MFEWNNVQSKTEMEFILDCILKEIKGKKITKIFDLDNEIVGKNSNGIIGCKIDNELYIQFENKKCLIINLTDESNAFIEYRYLNDEEKERYEIIEQPDLFNCHHEIHTWIKDEDGNPSEPSKTPYHIYDISLKYDSIKNFEVIGFNHEYLKWISNGNTCDMITIPKGGDYFNQINIHLVNGVILCIRVQDAIMDGYADVWIENSNKNLEYKETKREKYPDEI